MKSILLIFVVGLLILFLILLLIFSSGRPSKTVAKHDDANNTPIKRYLKSVYGSSPQSTVRDINEFDIIYEDKLKQSNIDYRNYNVTNDCPTKKGEWYRNMSGMWDPPNSIRIWNPPPYKSIPSKTWVEVVHCGNGKNEDNQKTGNWMYVSKGSGIYFYTGKTIVFDTHLDAVNHFLNTDECIGWPDKDECFDQFTQLFTTAKDKGYDSVQFLKHGDQRCGLSTIEIVDVNGNTNYGCGDPSPDSDSYKKRYRTGWNASKPCKCTVNENPYAGCLNCK